MPRVSRVPQPPPILVALGAAVVVAFAAGVAWTALSQIRDGEGWRPGGAGILLTTVVGWLGFVIARFAYRLFRLEMEPVASYGIVHRWPTRIRGRVILGRHRTMPHEMIAALGRAAAGHDEIEQIYLGFMMDAAGDGVEKLVVGFVTGGDIDAAARAIGPALEGLIPAGRPVIVADVARDQGLMGQHFRAFEKPVWRRGDGQALDPTAPVPID